MSSLAIQHDPAALDLHFGTDSITFDLADGRVVSAPLAWFPRLLSATASQRANWERIGRGYGIHWPEIDEDISILALLGLPD